MCLLEGSLPRCCCSLLLPNEDTHAIRLAARGAWATFPRTMIYELHLSTTQATLNARPYCLADRLPLYRWVDTDSVVLNHALSPCASLPLETLPHVYALVAAGHNWLSNGVFYLKVRPSSVDLLTKQSATHQCILKMILASLLIRLRWPR